MGEIRLAQLADQPRNHIAIGPFAVVSDPSLAMVNSIQMSNPTQQSPQITHLSWGRMEIDGLGAGRDFKLYPGGGRAWDWRETNTHHVPGIQAADVEELLDHGSKIVVLSRGMELALHTAPETLALLKERQVAYHIEETKAAVTLYNQLANAGDQVGGLFHSTC